MRKYEGKSSVARFNAALGATCRWCAVNRLLGEASMLFILAAKSFSEMFTTYSHALCPVLASGLETRNPFQNRQEKNEFYFLRRKKNFLTKKRKRACPREHKKIDWPQPICRDASPLSIRNRSVELICIIRPVRTPELTGLAYGAIFPASRMPG
jgi:hypothetical protein